MHVNFEVLIRTTRSPSNRGFDGVYELVGSVVSSAPTYLRMAELIPPSVPAIPGGNLIPAHTMYFSSRLMSQVFAWLTIVIDLLVCFELKNTWEEFRTKKDHSWTHYKRIALPFKRYKCLCSTNAPWPLKYSPAKISIWSTGIGWWLTPSASITVIVWSSIEKL